ncbi:hypothetical protein MMC16_006201 [Acarospora aff. strigata]|nr:hypothetical protein [Acarospora aff. strigata]
MSPPPHLPATPTTLLHLPRSPSLYSTSAIIGSNISPTTNNPVPPPSYSYSDNNKSNDDAFPTIAKIIIITAATVFVLGFLAALVNVVRRRRRRREEEIRARWMWMRMREEMDVDADADADGERGRVRPRGCGVGSLGPVGLEVDVVERPPPSYVAATRR